MSAYQPKAYDLKELRNEARFKAHFLPEEMRHYIISLNSEYEIIINVMDASMNGLGFVAAMPPEYLILNGPIVIYPIERNFKLYGRVAHITDILGKSCRVGVIFQEGVSLYDYQRTLFEILNENKLGNLQMSFSSFGTQI